jgi:hypothetical protein
MITSKAKVCSALFILLAGLCPFASANADPVAEAVTGGQAHMNTRLRYETVDDDVNDDADALTLRTRLGYTTADLSGFNAMVEFEDVRTVAGVDDYAPEQAGYAVVADPEVTELNRSWLQYRSRGFQARYGRQRIILGNARFVGNVGWRQNEQTFDAGRLDYSNDQFSVTGAWITAVESIVPGLDANTSHALLHADWKKAPGGTLSAYSYMLEDDTSESELDTHGARYSGALPLEDIKLLLTLEYATQETDTDAEADYNLVEAGFSAAGITVKVAREVLGSDDGNYGFQTPLATKHAFNGWADKFLATPATGLQDQYVMVGGKLAGTTLKAFYHDYAADEGDAEYGTETNIVAARGFGEHYKAGIKFADYHADDFATDTQKVWLWGEFNF